MSDETPETIPDDTPDATPDTAPDPTPHHRGLRWLLVGRHGAAALIGVLVAGLGFAIAVQVHANSSSDNLSNLRADDLIGILDNQDARAKQLEQQIADLQQTLRRLQDSTDRDAAARQQAQQDAAALGVLLGTLPASGPGVRVTVNDPQGKLQPEDLLDVVEELRGAGAEAIQFGSVRVSTESALTGGPGDIRVDGTPVSAPYTVLAIGDPTTLDTALNIPGGVAAALRTAGGALTVDELQALRIDVVRTLSNPRYATPTSR